MIGTVGTISSESYPKAIRKIDKSIKTFACACPLLVALAEEGYINKKATYIIVGEYLEFLIKKKIDTLILGCTHYPLLKKVIAKIVGKRIKIIDSAEEAALELKRCLMVNGRLSLTKRRGNHTFFVSDAPDKFVKVGEKFLGRKIFKVQKIDVERF